MTMTVKDLKKALKGVHDDVSVTVCLPHYAVPEVSCPYMYHAVEAHYVKPWGVGGDEFEIVVDEGFEY